MKLKNVFKNGLLIFVFFFGITLLYSVYAEPSAKLGSDVILNKINTISSSDVLSTGENDGLTLLQSIFKWIKNSLTSFVLIVAVGVFLYIGARLSLARGNPEEFKKAMMQLVYAIVGIFVISAAWAAVTLVAGLNI